MLNMIDWSHVTMTCLCSVLTAASYHDTMFRLEPGIEKVPKHDTILSKQRYVICHFENAAD